MKNIHCYAFELTNTIYIKETNPDNTKWVILNTRYSH